MSQPNTFFQLMSFHIKCATKNPFGHSVHFQHSSTSQAKCIQSLKAQLYIEGKSYCYHLALRKKVCIREEHGLLSPMEIKKEYSVKRGFSSSKSVTHFVKSVSETEILVDKSPYFCCILDAHWSALSAGKRLLQIHCCQWKNMTQITSHFSTYFHFVGWNSGRSTCGLVTKLSDLFS